MNLLLETVQVRGHKICFCAELMKIILIIIKYSLLSGVLSVVYKYETMTELICIIQETLTIVSGGLQIVKTVSGSLLIKVLDKHSFPQKQQNMLQSC